MEQRMESGGPVDEQRANGAQLHLVLDDIKDYAIFLIDLEGRIASWGASAEAVEGYRRDEIIGEPLSILFSEPDRIEGKPQRELAIALHTGIYEGEELRRKKDGTLFHAEVTLRLLRDLAGAPRAFIEVTRDITERRELEAAERQRREYEQELLGIASHDLRNPINAVLLGAQSLLLHGSLTSRQSETLLRIVSSSQRAARMVRDLLDFTQAKLGGGLSLTPRPLELHHFAAEVVDELLVTHPGRQAILEPSGDGDVFWDADRVARLITNLVANALDHGAIDLPVTVRTAGDREFAVIEVHNFGDPIPPKLIPTLFERLTHSHAGRREPGSIGLGLYIVAQIARAHGGEIRVRSTAEEGTTFTLRMPRMPPVQQG